MAKNQIDAKILGRVGLNLEPPNTLPDALNSDEVLEIRWMPTTEKMTSVLEAHREWCESDGTNGQKADLSYANLSGADLSGERLRSANFSKALLHGVNLSGADLRGADFSGEDIGDDGADLLGADLRDANLSEADFANADLAGADLTGANLSEAVLVGSNIKEATGLMEGNFAGAKLADIDLSETYLLNVDLSEALLLHADLSEAWLTGANLSSAELKYANLSGAKLQLANLSRADAEKADLSEADLEGVDLSEAKLQGAELAEARLQSADFSKARLDDADLDGVEGFQAAQVRGASLSLTTLPDAVQEFAGLSTARATTQSAKKLFISVLVACAYAALAVTLKTGNTETIQLPIVGLSIGTGSFYFVTPVLLMLLFGYFHLQMQRLWRELAQLPTIFPDGKPVDGKVHPWLVTTGLMRGHTRLLMESRKEELSPLFVLLQYGVALLLAWGTVPITLIYFTGMYSPGPDPAGSLFLHVLTALTLVGGTAAYRKAIRTLELRDHHMITFWKPDTSGNQEWLFESTGFWGSVTLLITAVSVWYLRLYGFSLP